MLNRIYLGFLFVIILLSKKCLGGADEFLDIANANSDNDLKGPPHDSLLGDYDIMGNFPSYTAPAPALSGCLNPANDNYIHPDLNLKCGEIIEKYNYNLETHSVTTDDGYILTVFRIKGGPKSPPKPGKVPALLVHGLAGNCMSWLFLWKEKCLAFKLADAGYDVWLANIRGNSYSQKHTTYDTNSDQYWDFSYDDTGYYDVPAMIDHILNVTSQKDLYYVGHSLGTGQYLISTSERPEYGKKIRVGFLLCPAGLFGDISNPLITGLLNIGTPFYKIWKAEFGNFLDEAKLNGDFKAIQVLCPKEAGKCGACSNLMFTSNGVNAKQQNGSIVFYFSSRYTDTTSTKIFCHLAQTQYAREGVMRKFDYMDATRNLLKYGSTKPPQFNFDRITSSTIIFWGLADNLTPAVGVKKLTQLFAKGVLKENNRVPDPEMNHLDFLMANDVNKLVYDRIQFVMDKGLYYKK